MLKTKADRDRVRQKSADKKINHKRGKLTAKQRGQITQSVRKQLHARSGGFCERCGGIAAHAAHVTRRWRIEGRTTVEDLLHFCIPCHVWADTSAEGRAYLRQIEETKNGGIAQ